MKVMSCKQLGGACDLKFKANSFEEMAELSKKHGFDMYQKGDHAHIQAMNEMKEWMASKEKMSEWMDSKRKLFNDLPDQD
jgi:hypothetical protein